MTASMDATTLQDTESNGASLFGLPESLIENVHKAHRSLDGWCSLEKALDLCRLVLNNNCRTVVEIGVFGGRSMIPMAHALSHLDEGAVFGIEPFQNQIAIETQTGEINDLWWQRVDFVSVKSRLYRYIAENGLGKTAKMIELSSDEALAAFSMRGSERSIDLLHIDGSHSPVQALRDVTNWTRLLGPRGIVVLDDVLWDTVQPARKYLVDNFIVVEEVSAEGTAYGIYRR
jgi:predicted O-methyltransferase YrrM